MTKKTEKTVKFIDSKGKESKENNKFPERKDDAKTIRKIWLLNLTPDSVNKIQVSATDSSLTIGGEYDDSVGWTSLPKISELSDRGNTSNSDDTERLYLDFYKPKT